MHSDIRIRDLLAGAAIAAALMLSAKPLCWAMFYLKEWVQQ